MNSNGFVVLILLVVPYLTTSFHIECDYNIHEFLIVGRINTCSVINPLNIKSPDNALISSMNLLDNFDEFNVLGLYITNKTLYYFPKGLEIFEKLRAIEIKFSQLKQISQSDIRGFPELRFFSVFGNDIEVLESGLFEYNPMLEFAAFSINKIKMVYPKVFNNNPHLVSLWLDQNICIDTGVDGNYFEVVLIIKEAETLCTGSKAEEIIKEIGPESAKLSTTTEQEKTTTTQETENPSTTTQATSTETPILFPDFYIKIKDKTNIQHHISSLYDENKNLRAFNEYVSSKINKLAAEIELLNTDIWEEFNNIGISHNATEDRLSKYIQSSNFDTMEKIKQLEDHVEDLVLQKSKELKEIDIQCKQSILHANKFSEKIEMKTESAIESIKEYIEKIQNKRLNELAGKVEKIEENLMDSADKIAYLTQNLQDTQLLLLKKMDKQIEDMRKQVDKALNDILNIVYHSI